MITVEAFLQGLQTHGLSLATRVVEGTTRLVLSGDEEVIARKKGISTYITANREALIDALSVTSVTKSNESFVTETADSGDGIPRCYYCRVVLMNDPALFRADEDLKDLVCVPCFEATHQLPQATPSAPMQIALPTLTTTAYIDAWYAKQPARIAPAGKGKNRKANTRVATKDHCSKHGPFYPLKYRDEQGKDYCEHTDCYSRYRLSCAGESLGYPALIGVLDQRDHLPDTSQAPITHTDPHYPGAPVHPVYPTRPIVTEQLIPSGSEAWQTFISEQGYVNIDTAVRATLKLFTALNKQESIFERM